MVEYHKTVSQIKDLLIQNNAWFEVFEHEPVRTSAEAALVRTGYTLDQGAKALLIEVLYKLTKEKEILMCVIPGSARLHNSKLKQILNIKEYRFVSEDQVKEITSGVEPGGVPPFGNIFGLKVFVDKTLLENDKMIFNAGDKRFSIAMTTADYKDIVKPQVVNVI